MSVMVAYYIVGVTVDKKKFEEFSGYSKYCANRNVDEYNNAECKNENGDKVFHCWLESRNEMA